MPCIIFLTENRMAGCFPQSVSLGLSPAEGAGGGRWGMERSGCSRESLLQEVFIPAPLHKTSQKIQGGPSEWPPSLGKLRISSQLSSVLWNTNWEGGPLPLLRPPWNDVKHINQYKRGFLAPKTGLILSLALWDGGRKELTAGLEGIGNIVLREHWIYLLPNPAKKSRSHFQRW